MPRTQRAEAATSHRVPADESGALYALPLDQFTPARDALAARLRKSGHTDEAEAVKVLKKPTPPVWAIN